MGRIQKLSDELANQIADVTRDVSRVTNHRSVAIFGGVSQNPQTDKLRRGVDVVIACPGRYPRE